MLCVCSNYGTAIGAWHNNISVNDKKLMGEMQFIIEFSIGGKIWDTVYMHQCTILLQWSTCCGLIDE